MKNVNSSSQIDYDISQDENRKALIESLPVTERRLEIAGLQTAVLEGGGGPPVVLLHGPGESCFWWMQVIPELVESFRVIVPDLPGHGESETEIDEPVEEQIMTWLDQLIYQTCSENPVLIGHVLGGAIAARFAIQYPDRFSELVLVDSLGLGKFRPSLGFAFNLIRFSISPTRKNYERFLPKCMHNTDTLKQNVGEHWESMIQYYLTCSQDKKRMNALQSIMKKVGIPVIPPAELGNIKQPVSLIWGRHDRANKLKIAEEASKRYEWPLFVIDKAGDDPKMEQPEAFLEALFKLLQKETIHTV